MNEKQLDKTLRDLLEDHKLWVESDGNEGERLDLNDADLRRANLISADLREANLFQAYLIDAYLCFAFLTGSNLRSSNLTDANLIKVDLTRANLKEATIKRSQINEMIIEEDLIQPEEMLKIIEEVRNDCRKNGLDELDAFIEDKYKMFDDYEEELGKTLRKLLDNHIYVNLIGINLTKALLTGVKIKRSQLDTMIVEENVE